MVEVLSDSFRSSLKSQLSSIDSQKLVCVVNISEQY